MRAWRPVAVSFLVIGFAYLADRALTAAILQHGTLPEAGNRAIQRGITRPAETDNPVVGPAVRPGRKLDVTFATKAALPKAANLPGNLETRATRMQKSL